MRSPDPVKPPGATRRRAASPATPARVASAQRAPGGVIASPAAWLGKEAALAAQALAAWFEGFEAMRQVQAQAARAAATAHQAAAGRLAQVGDVAGLIALESELAKFDAEQCAQYWAQLGAIGLNAQLKLGTGTLRMLGLGAEPPWQTALEVWQSPFSVPLD